MVKKIDIKNTKTIEEYIKISYNVNSNNILYSYIKICNKPGFDRDHHTFNKYSFINYLESIGIKKSILKQVEELKIDSE